MISFSFFLWINGLFTSVRWSCRLLHRARLLGPRFWHPTLGLNLR